VIEEIKPALDAEDWAVELAEADDFSRTVHPAGDFGGAVFVRDGRIAVTYDNGAAAQFVADDERHRLAALALHGQPFGFTREDVIALERTIASAQYHVGRGEVADYIERAKSISDKLDALLPPEQ
jgi:hypothetical protein